MLDRDVIFDESPHSSCILCSLHTSVWHNVLIWFPNYELKHPMAPQWTDESSVEYFFKFFFKLIFKTILVIHLRQGAQAWAEAEREKQACFPAVLGAWPDWLAGLGDKTWAQGRCPNIWPTQVPTVEYFKFLRETATLANYHMNYYPVIALSFSIRYH